jgi:hypothetical protein
MPPETGSDQRPELGSHGRVNATTAGALELIAAVVRRATG